MKKLLLIIALFLPAASFAQIKSANLTASGLTCSMCSKAIYKALLKVPFIKDVQVDIKSSSYTMTFRPGAAVVPDDIKKAVENAGFSVASMQVTAFFPPTEIYNDAHISFGGAHLHFLNVPKQTISGDKTLTLVDKNFLPAKDHKKYGQYTKMACFETGTIAACCAKEGPVGTRIYHVTL